NMAALESCPKNNMIAYLEKTERNVEQLANISVPLDHFPVNSLTSKVFSFMIKKGKHFSGKVTPLFDTMLVQPTQDEGASSERLSVEQSSPSPAPTGEVPNESLPDSSSAQPSEVPIEHQPDPSPRPSPTPTIPDSIPEPSGENLEDHSSNDTSLSGNEDEMTLQNVYDLCISLCQQVTDQAKEIKLLKAKIKKLKKQAKPVINHHKAYLKTVSLQQRFPRKSFSKKHRVHKKSVSKQGRKIAKGESTVQKDPLFDAMTEDKIDHMETENAQSEGRTRDLVDEDKGLDEDRLSTEDGVSTDKERVSTDFEKVSTDRPKVSTDGSKVSTDEQVEGTEELNEGTEEIFEGTEQQREGTEEKVESTAGQIDSTEDQSKEEIPTEASQTSTQTPTSMVFGDDETIATLLLNMSKAKVILRKRGTRSEDINLNVVTRSNGQKRYFSTLTTILSIFDREDLNAVYQLVMDKYQDEMPEGFERVLWGDLMVLFNPDEQDEFWNSQHEWKVISWKLHSSSGVHTLMTDEGLVIHMLIEKKYPLKKEIVMQMLKLKLESEEESTMALELIRFIKKVLADLESKEVLNSPCFLVKSWLVQDQTVLGKDYSNLLIADSLLKTIWFINAPCYDNEALASPNTNDEELSIPEQTATGKGTSNPLMAGSLPKTTKPT
ncbi:hypothetical protein Tco_1261172, partial [Tanacetum coccineum]